MLANIPSIVFIVDDDPDMRDSLEYLIHSVGILTQAYSSASVFLAEFELSRPGCLVCDIRMPEMSGLDLFDRLIGLGSRLPVILMTAHADVPMAVRAFKLGVAEFIEKPFNAQVMLERIQRALVEDRTQRASLATWKEFGDRMAELSDKEQATLKLILSGVPNKAIAARVEITERAVEARRAGIMKKLNVSTFAELIRQVTHYQLLFPDQKE